MYTRGLRHLAVGLVLCLGVVGCSHNAKQGAKGQGAYTQGAGEGAGFVGSEQERELLSRNKIYFAFDSSGIDAGYADVINAHANYMRQTNRPVRIEGHADEQGSREYNVALGERRARAVANALAAQGVAPQQIAIVSFGKEKPEAMGHSEEAHRLNRRAVIVYEN